MRGDSPASCDRALSDAVSERVLRRGLSPLLLGGDHSITYPAFRALVEHWRRRDHRPQLPSRLRNLPLCIVHFDAHPDLYEV